MVSFQPEKLVLIVDCPYGSQSLQRVVITSVGLECEL